MNNQVVLFIILIPQIAYAQEPKPVHSHQEFLNACRSGLQTLEQRARQYTGQFQLIEGGYRLPSRVVCDIQCAGKDNQLYFRKHYRDSQSKDEPVKQLSTITIRAANNYYDFHIQQLDSPDAYKLVQYNMQEDPPKISIGSYIVFLNRTVYSTHWLDDLPLGPLLEHPTFHIKSLEDRVENEVEVARCQFTASPASPLTHEKLKWPVGEIEGWFDVIPSLSYAVAAYQFRAMVPGATPQVPPALRRTRGETNYGTADDGLPVARYCKRVTGWLDLPEDAFFEATDIQINYGKYLPDEQMRLSYYNLPEPAGAPAITQSTPLYAWTFLGAGVLILFAVIARWLAARQRSNKSDTGV